MSLMHGTSPAKHLHGRVFLILQPMQEILCSEALTSAGRFGLHEIQVDHAGEMGLTYYRMYLFSGDKKYLTASLNVANVLASKYRRREP